MRHGWILTLALPALLGGITACDDGRDSGHDVSVTEAERQSACDSLSRAGSTSKLVQAGESLAAPRVIDATGAPRTVMLKGSPGEKHGFLALNVDDAAFLMLVGSDMPVKIIDDSGEELTLADSLSNPSWCDAAAKVRVWRAAAGQTSMIELGPTALDEVVLVVSHVDQE